MRGAEIADDLSARLERFRVELTAYCYRMLGSPFEAEDAVQETLLRAWRNASTYDQTRSAFRSWLYTIATNVCLDMLKSSQRRALAVDLGPAATPGAPLGAPLPDERWVLPVPDSRVLPAGGDPADLAVLRDSVRLAFVAALQALPPRQRAVLILRDVLCWRADEVAGLLGTTTAAVNSSLQRARAALPAVPPATATLGPSEQELLARYVDAFARDDIDTLVSLLHEDATSSMPPFVWWLAGREALRAVMLAAGNPCAGAWLVPVEASGSPALVQYRESGPFAVLVMELDGGAIRSVTTFLQEHVVALFAR